MVGERSCVPYVLDAQNPDGGWGFSPGLESRVEPTSWALLALHEISQSKPGEITPPSYALASGETEARAREAAARGFGFLEKVQLADGSWPSAAGQVAGSWVTSLACWALLARGDASPKLERGIRWLDEVKPGDAQFMWRFARGVIALASRQRVNAQSDSYWGWSWTEGTASWVEPTAQALIVLRIARAASSSRENQQRQELAEKMLYDRMCPGGGWNCGNPMVYGVPGEPLVGPTVWALLALRPHAERQENQLSLAWLAQNWTNIQSPASLALASIGLQAYGRQIPEIRAALETLYAKDESALTVPVAAWTALALSGKMKWLNLAMPGKTG